MLKKIISHTFFYSFANQIPSLINLFLLPFLTPFLKAEDYAIYGLILSYAGLVGAFSSLGYVVLFQQSYFELGESFKPRWSRLLGFQWLYKFFYAGMVAILLYFSLENKIDGDRLNVVLILVITPLLFFDLTKSIASRLLQFRHEHQRVYTITIAVGIVSAFTSFIGIRYFNLGYMAWLYSQVISSGLLSIYFGYILYWKEKIRPSFDLTMQEISADIKTATPLIPMEYATYLLSSSDRILLDRMGVASGKIGQYNIAYSFASYFDNIQMQANQVVSPVIFNLLKEGSLQAQISIGKIIRLWFYISLIMASVLGLWLPDIFHFLYRKEELSSSYPMAIILIFGFCYRPIFAAIGDKAIYEKKTLHILKITVFSAFINLTLNLLFINEFEIWTATFSSVMAYFTMGICGYFLFDQVRDFRKIIRPVQLLSIAAIFAVCIYFLHDFSWEFRCFTTLLLSGGAFVWYKKKGKFLLKELNQIRHGFSSR